MLSSYFILFSRKTAVFRRLKEKITGQKCLKFSLDQSQSLSKIHQIPNVLLQYYCNSFLIARCLRVYSIFFFHCCIGFADTYLPMECVALQLYSWLLVANDRTTYRAWLLRPRHGWSSRAPVAANRFNAGWVVICWLSDLKHKNA